MPTHAPPTRTLRLPLAVFAIATLTASIGCIAPHHGGRGGGTLAHLVGFDAGRGCGDDCQCGDCAVDGCADCPPDGCDITDSGGACCESGGGDCQGSECGTIPACDAVCRVAHLPCESVECVTSCCTPHACPGPRDVPPPGRFHPVPTRPVFSPRFEPAPYGPAEF